MNLSTNASLDHSDLAVFLDILRGIEPRTAAGATASEPCAASQQTARLVSTALYNDALGFLIHRGTPIENAQISAAFDALRLPYKAKTLRQNSRLLDRTTQVSAYLDAAGIRHLVLKGPLRQQQVYGDRFVRPSGDVDLLVVRKDFDATVKTLENEGFTLAHPEDIRLWWRTFLGQVHLVHRDDPSWSIDLHHRLQQPEAEQPRGVAAFFEDAVALPGSPAGVLVPHRRHAALISAMNLVKALHKRRPDAETEWRRNTIVHVCDLYSDLGGLVDADSAPRDTQEVADRVSAFMETAERHGQAGSARLALRVVEAVFGPTPGMRPEAARSVLPWATDEDLTCMVLAPHLATRWPAPHELLLALCAPDRPRFVGHLAWYAASSAVRRSMLLRRWARERV